ncbi:MAG TPA: hypothetical protein VMY37_23530 [Thermoguttaceae bacterium]|nr:hypothetical protein [Thermoguttaceae bacterium]
MSENQSNDKATGANAPTPHTCGPPTEERPHAIKGPHFASHSPKVLARVPNLESAESELVGETLPAGEDGRMLSSRWSMRILGVGGAMLLVAALALPLLLGNSDSPESAWKDESPAWQPDPLAPSAAAAPAWGSPSDGASGWQLPSTDPRSSQAQTPVISAWSEQSPPLDWDASSQAQPWDAAAKAQTWDAPSDAKTWTDQPPMPAWQGHPDTALTDDRPQWNAPGENASAVWGGQGDVAAGALSSDGPVWSTQPSPAPGVYREASGSWNEDVQTPRWPVPQYRTAEQAQAGGTVWDGGTVSASPAVDSSQLPPTAATNRPMWALEAPAPSPPPVNYETTRPAPPSYESYRSPDAYRQPQINTNRSMQIPAYPESGTFDPGADRPPNAQPVYRAADARVNPWSGAAVDDRTGYQDTAGESAFPANGPPMSSAPATSYPPNGYPEGSYRQTAYPSTTSSPSDYHQDRYPKSNYPSASYPAYPSANYPETRYPATQLPASAYPAADRPSPVDPRYGSTDPSVGTSPPPRYDAGGYPRSSQPGVARFQGGIEKPTGTDVHDDYRPSIY